MNCRTFQKSLEDYLENSLDFAGRFGMERHARQCVLCGREMSDAQQLSRLARGLDKVKAPPNFESTVLDEIGRRKLRSRFPMFRHFLLFGFDMLSWRQYAFAASGVLVFGLGLLLFRNLEIRKPPQPAGEADVGAVESPAVDRTAQDRIPPMTGTTGSRKNTALNREGVVGNVSEEGLFADYYANESEYREYRAIGPDNLPMIVPLPGRIQMQVTPPPEEYFIRNVSH